MSTKHNLWEVLLFCFNLKKSAPDGHRLVCEAYGEHAPSIKTCDAGSGILKVVIFKVMGMV